MQGSPASLTVPFMVFELILVCAALPLAFPLGVACASDPEICLQLITTSWCLTGSPTAPQTKVSALLFRDTFCYLQLGILSAVLFVLVSLHFCAFITLAGFWQEAEVVTCVQSVHSRSLSLC